MTNLGAERQHHASRPHPKEKTRLLGDAKGICGGDRCACSHRRCNRRHRWLSDRSGCTNRDAATYPAPRNHNSDRPSTSAREVIDGERQNPKDYIMQTRFELFKAQLRWEPWKALAAMIAAAAVFMGGVLAASNWVRPSTPRTINVHLDAPLVVQPTSGQGK
jgi:hypothetical protein